MILGHINVKESEAVYSRRIQRAITYYGDMDVSEMEEGRYPQDGDDFIVLIDQRRTESREEKLPGVRREYAELQYMVSGREYMGFYPDGGGNEVLEDCLEEEDTLYYKGDPGSGEVMLPLVPGSYEILLPEDVHRPFCQVDGPEDIKKIVIRIRMSTLQDRLDPMTTGFVVIKHRLLSFDCLDDRLQQL